MVRVKAQRHGSRVARFGSITIHAGRMQVLGCLAVRARHVRNHNFHEWQTATFAMVTGAAEIAAPTAAGGHDSDHVCECSAPRMPRTKRTRSTQTELTRKNWI